MSQSPGHRKWPEHRVHEEPIHERVRALILGDVVADSTSVIRVEEDGQPPRYYFPRDDVKMDALESTDTSTTCPFKGTAGHFTFRAGSVRLEDVAWTYEEPYDEHQQLRGRIAFYEEKMPQIRLELA
jgi:uncharacterized protein (DUF427 family)